MRWDQEQRYTYEHMGDIPKEKRREIIEYYVSHGRQETRQHYSISPLAMGHLQYHYKHWIEEIEEANFAKVGL